MISLELLYADKLSYLHTTVLFIVVPKVFKKMTGSHESRLNEEEKEEKERKASDVSS